MAKRSYNQDSNNQNLNPQPTLPQKRRKIDPSRSTSISSTSTTTSSKPTWFSSIKSELSFSLLSCLRANHASLSRHVLPPLLNLNLNHQAHSIHIKTPPNRRWRSQGRLPASHRPQPLPTNFLPPAPCRRGLPTISLRNSLQRMEVGVE